MLQALFDKLVAILRRDVLTSARHRAGFVVQAGSVIAELAGFYFLARAIGPAFRPDGIDYYPFLLIGTAMFSFLIGGVSVFVNAIQEAQVTGTMEVVMTTATPAPVIVLLSAFSAFSGRVVRMLIYIAAGAVLYRGVFHPNWPAAAIVVALSVAVAVAFGMLAASVQLAIQKGSAVIWLFSVAGWLLTGTAFPINSLPAALRHVSKAIPVSYSIQGLRTALLQNHFSPAVGAIVALAISAAVLLPLSVVLFSTVVRRARMHGTLSFY